ncbi:hypothetical protein J6590_089745 [Homalodisca vitripennis]|nr:hypothetical protein J6590_089745 [Homalodisca vitripennis]
MVRGHTFLPADRVFGRVERELKKHVTIQSKEEYLNVYRMFGTHSISQPKKKDVDSLLKELFGEAWRECEAFPQRQWYVDIIDSRTNDKL